LAKDVPFAAGYWMLFEPARKMLLQQGGAFGTEEAHSASRSQVYSANAAAGFCAAFAAAFVTTPLDVVKTHAQMGVARRGMAQTAAIITGAGGVRALFTGAGPRSVRAGCAYAILMSSYEAFKSLELGAHHTASS
jgi:solute carrier family 25 protein 39/40